MRMNELLDEESREQDMGDNIENLYGDEDFMTA